MPTNSLITARTCLRAPSGILPMSGMGISFRRELGAAGEVGASIVLPDAEADFWLGFQREQLSTPSEINAEYKKIRFAAFENVTLMYDRIVTSSSIAIGRH